MGVAVGVDVGAGVQVAVGVGEGTITTMGSHTLQSPSSGMSVGVSVSHHQGVDVRVGVTCRGVAVGVLPAKGVLVRVGVRVAVLVGGGVNVGVLASSVQTVREIWSRYTVVGRE